LGAKLVSAENPAMISGVDRNVGPVERHEIRALAALAALGEERRRISS
jgi:hypothetical protein